MQPEILYCVESSTNRKPLKAIIRYAGTENYIERQEVNGQITPDMVKLWRMLGLSDSDIKRIVGFLRS